MKKVIIASKNPIKVQATQNAFAKMFTEESFEFLGVSVSSNVSEQPMSDEETLSGAVNRIRNAQKENPDADYYVGLEAGLQERDGKYSNFHWMVVLSKEGKIGKSRSASFELPPKIAELIKQGYSLGDADDKVFSRTNSSQKDGAIGILSHGVIKRVDFCEEAMIFALVPFKNPELY